MLWQHVDDIEYYQVKVPNGPVYVIIVRQLLGDAGVEVVLKAAIYAAVKMKSIRPNEFERVIVDSTEVVKAVVLAADR